MHENLERKAQTSNQGSSDRFFGLVMAAFFGVVGAWPLIDRSMPHWWSVGLAGVFVLLALAIPGVLAPLNRFWTKFGLLLHKITNPIFLGAIFFIVVTPMAIGLRLMGKDPLRRRLDPSAVSYWISRDPPGPSPETMNRQF